MSKPKINIIPTSSLPKGTVRTWNAQRERVWLYKGVEFKTKRDLLHGISEAINGPTPAQATIEGVMPEAAVEVIMNEGETHEGTI